MKSIKVWLPAALTAAVLIGFVALTLFDYHTHTFPEGTFLPTK